MFERIRLYHKCLSKTFGEFYYLDAEDQNSNVRKSKIRIPILIVIGLRYQLVKGNTRIATRIKIGPEFQ